MKVSWLGKIWTLVLIPSQHLDLLAVNEREESFDSQWGIIWGVTPIEKKFGIGMVEVKCFEGEGEEGLYGMACVCEEGSVFDGEEAN